jgi:N-acetylneuraminic acid mutarotase
VTSFDSKIYVLGGEGLKGAFIQAVEVYDPTIDRWKEVGTLPKPRRNHATCTVNGKLWSCGGTSSSIEAQSTDELVLVNELFLYRFIFFFSF